MQITLSQQYNVGEKPTVILYTSHGSMVYGIYCVFVVMSLCLSPNYADTTSVLSNKSDKYVPTSFDQQFQVSQGHTSYKNKEN